MPISKSVFRSCVCLVQITSSDLEASRISRRTLELRLSEQTALCLQTSERERQTASLLDQARLDIQQLQNRGHMLDSRIAELEQVMY